MFRILSVIVSLLLFHTYALAEDEQAKELPPLPPQTKEAPPIEDNNNADAIKSDDEASNVPEAGQVKKVSSAKKDINQHKQVIEEYKRYLSTIPEEVRDEIREYRKEVIRLNKQKIALYKKLSQEAQSFLSKERNFKKRLPFRERRKVKE